MIMEVSATSSNGYNARVWKGHYWDLSSEVSYSASGNSKVYLNGTFGFYPYITYDNSSGVSSSASFTEGLFSIQLMVNGKLVGSSVSGTRLRLSNYELDLSKLGNIYSNAAVPVMLNIMADRADVVATLAACKFGTVLSCNFSLVAKDNLYRLVLVSAEPYKA